MTETQNNKQTSRNFFNIGILKLFVFWCLFFGASLFVAQTADAGVISMPPNNLGLVGYWSFNEGSGTVAGDHSGNGNHGTLENSPTWVDGKRGKALGFNGSDQYVDMDNTLGFERTDTFSVSAWVKTTDTSNTKSIVSKLQSGSPFRGWEFSKQSAAPTKLRFTLISTNNTNEIRKQSSIDITDGTWKHVVATYDGSSSANGVSLYVDGSLDTGATNITNSLSGTIQNTVPLQVGARDGANTVWDGSIDEVRIYNRALSASEIERLYRSGSARIGASTAGQLTDGLVGHWTFDGQDGLTDLSGNGNDGTVNGDAMPAIGVIGQGYSFNGNGSDVSIGDFTEGKITTKTVSFWAKRDTAAGTEGVFSMGGANWYVGFASSGRMLASHQNTAPTQQTSYSSDGIVDVGEWHLYTYVWEVDGSDVDVSFYKDGAFDQTDSYSTGHRTSYGSSAYVGGFNGSSGGYSGDLDDVRIYDRALSEQEVNQLYRLGQATINKTSETGVKKSNLVGHWTFDGPTISGSTVSDVSGNGNTGTASGDASPAIGKIGQGFEFDGASDYVTITDNAGIGIQDNFTVSFWYRENGKEGTVRTLINKSGQYWFRTSSNNKLYIYYYIDGNVQACRSPFDFPLEGEWHHIVTTFENNGANFLKKTYLDNTLVEDVSCSLGALSDVTNVLTIGDSGSAGISGIVDDLRIYNTALSASEVLQLYNETR